MLGDMIKEFRNEIKNIFSDKSLILMLFAAPVFYAFFYGSVYLNKVDREIEVVVVDYDQSAVSRNYINLLDASGMIKITGNLPLIDEAMESFRHDENHAVMYIPKGFEEDLKKGKGGNFKIFLNNTRFLVSNDIFKAVSEISATMGAGIRLRLLRSQGLSADQAYQVVEPVRIDMRSLYNTTESYGDFLIPGILILVIQQTLIIGFGESLAKDREKGLLAGKSGAWMAGKSLPYFIMHIAYTFMFYTITFDLFSLVFKGNMVLLLLISVLFVMAVITFTYFIASFIHKKLEALLLLAFTSYPAFLISGYSWPGSAMPVALKYLGYIFPTTPFFEIYIKITQFGAGLNDVLPQVMHLFIIFAVGLVLSKIRYNSLIKNAVKTAV